MTQGPFAQKLLSEAKKVYEANKGTKEVERLKAQVRKQYGFLRPVS